MLSETISFSRSSHDQSFSHFFLIFLTILSNSIIQYLLIYTLKNSYKKIIVFSIKIQEFFRYKIISYQKRIFDNLFISLASICSCYVCCLFGLEYFADIFIHFLTVFLHRVHILQNLYKRTRHLRIATDITCNTFLTLQISIIEFVYDFIIALYTLRVS